MFRCCHPHEFTQFLLIVRWLAASCPRALSCLCYLLALHFSYNQSFQTLCSVFLFIFLNYLRRAHLIIFVLVSVNKNKTKKYQNIIISLKSIKKKYSDLMQWLFVPPPTPQCHPNLWMTLGNMSVVLVTLYQIDTLCLIFNLQTTSSHFIHDIQALTRLNGFQ